MSEKAIVVEGATCKCQFGNAPDKIKVLSHTKEYANNGKLIATTKEIGATTLNSLTGMVDIGGSTDDREYKLDGNSYRVKPTSSIIGTISFKIKGEAAKDIQLLPFADKTHFSAKYEFKGKEITMGVNWNRVYLFSKDRPSYHDEFIFTGIKGEYLQKFELKMNGEKILDSNPEGKMVAFELLPEMIFRTDPAYLPFT